jgi:intein/homing endonuclease
MYGYYDSSERRTRWAKTVAGGVGAAALGAALFNRQRVAQWAARAVEGVADNAVAQKYAGAVTKFAFDATDSFQNLLRQTLQNNQHFRGHFVEQNLVDRADHRAVNQARQDLSKWEYEHGAARQLSSVLGTIWTPEKVDAFLEQDGIFRSLINRRGTSAAEVPQMIRDRGGRFRDILNRDAEAAGRSFDDEMSQALRDLDAARPRVQTRAELKDQPLKMQARLEQEFADKLRAEARQGPTALNRMTGAQVAPIRPMEADRLTKYTPKDSGDPDWFDTRNLRGGTANARYEIGDKKYDFSALRSMVMSTKDFVADRIAVPLSLFQQGISAGQLFPFLARSGDRPVVGLYDQGLREGSPLQLFFGKRVISLADDGAITASDETFNFVTANKAHLRRYADAQRGAAAEGEATGNVFNRAFRAFRGGLGEVEPGTTPYWDKFQAFFRKFNAKDYEPNLLRRAGKGMLDSEADAMGLSRMLRSSSVKVSTEDILSVIADMQGQMLTLTEAGGDLRAGGTPLIRSQHGDEASEVARRVYEDGEDWPRRVDPYINVWSHQLQNAQGSEFSKYAQVHDYLNQFLEETHMRSPKMDRFMRDMQGMNQGDRERYLARTASYADSRRSETLFGLDLTTGAKRVTNLDILRGELLSGLQQVSQEETTNSYWDISRRAMARGQTHASFLAESFVIDGKIAADTADHLQDINDYLGHDAQAPLRSYLERESRARFSVLHTHPKNPAKTEDFSSRHSVIAIRTSREEKDGFLGLGRTWRAYTSPTSLKDGDATQGSLFTYFLADRLHSAFHEIGVGLPDSMKASPVHMALGMIALRYLPLVIGIPEAHKFINRVTRDVPLLRILNPDQHRANVLDYVSRMSHRGKARRTLLALIPGLDFYTDDRSQSDEDRAQRGAAYTPVRKGRWWAFGSREAFFGEKISYYAPSAARIARSDWQSADNVNLNTWQYWRHFGGYLNPTNWGNGAYWREEAGQKDRPYLQSGAAFDPGHPWSAPLNALFGWILKPKRVYHPEYLPKHLGGTLDDRPSTERPTSPFYRRSPVRSDEGPVGRVHSPGGGGGRSGPGSVSGSISGSQTGGSRSGGAPQRGGRDSRELPPGYSRSIPRAKKLRDPQYDPLLERINLARDLHDKDRLTQANESGMAPEEAAYIRSIGLSGGWDTSLYHLQEIAGLYGWFGSLARPQIGHPVGKVEVADASRGYGRERRFYDQEIGGIGGNISDILRRFLPHRRRSAAQYDPVPNNMPSWMPGADNLVDFTRGDPFIKVPLGEMRLPGSAHERLHPGTAARMFRMRASSIGKSQAEMESYLVKKEGDGSTSAAAEMGTKMHRVLQDRWRHLGIMEADEVEVFDPKLNVTGHIDAILRIPDRQGRQQRVIADIKTKTAAKYAEVVRTRKPEDENLDQILFYMQATGIKRGLLTYVNREDVRQVYQLEVKFDKRRFQQAVQRMEAARGAVKDRIRSGAVSAGELYDPLTKYEILADVAPYSRQFAEMQKWAERSKEAMSNEDQKRLEDAQARLKRQRGGFELHPYRFRPQRVQSDRVQIDKFVDRQTFLSTSGQTYRIAGINARNADRLDTLSSDDWWKQHTGLRQGSHVTVVTQTTSTAPPRVQAATVIAGGRNVGRELLRHGRVEEDREDYSEPARRTRFTGNQLLFGRAAEWLLHQNNPIACLAPWTQVITESGIDRVDSLQPGTKVLTVKGRFKPVVRVEVQPKGKRILDIKLCGSTIHTTVTDDHPLLAVKAERKRRWISESTGEFLDPWGKDPQPSFIEAGQLKPYDFLAYKPREMIETPPPAIDLLEVNPDRFFGDDEAVWVKGHNGAKQGKVRRCIQVDDDLARLMGYYAAEGCIGQSRGRNSQVIFTFHSSEAVYIEDVISLSRTVFGATATASVSGNTAHVRVTSGSMADVMALHVGKKKDKHAPETLLTNHSVRASFIRGLLRGDGIKCGYSRYTRIGMVSVNVLLWLRDALFHLWSIPSILSVFIKRKTNLYGLNIGMWKTLWEYIDGNTDYEACIADRGGFKLCNRAIVNGYILYRIESIAESEYQDVTYDVEVEDDDSFALLNFDVHNTKFTPVRSGLEQYERTDVYGKKSASWEAPMCLTPDNLIHSQEGMIPISDIKVGNKVLTHDGGWKQVTRVWQRDASERILKIRAHRTTDILKITPNHEIPVIRGQRTANAQVSEDEVVWIPAGQATLEDYLLLPVAKESSEQIDLWRFVQNESLLESDDTHIYQCLRHRSGKKIRGGARYGKTLARLHDPDSPLWKILGYYLAEGDCNGNQTRFSFHAEEEIYHNDLRDALTALGFSSTVTDQVGKSLRIAVYSGLLAKVLSSLAPGMAKGGTKRLDASVLGLPTAALLHILSSYFKGDGHSVKDQEVWSVTTSSRTLADQVRMILGRFGLPASLREGTNTFGKDSKTTKNYSLWVFGDEARTLLDLISDENKPCFEKTRGTSKPKRQTIRVGNSAIGYLIRSIEDEEYEGSLHDLEVEDKHSYTTASASVHNSSYVWPTLASFTNKNPVAAAGMGAILAGTFFAFSEQRIPALKYGAILGVALSVFGMVMRASGKPFIPWAVQRRRRMDTYYDNLTYVKYRRLAAQEEELAKHHEGRDVNDLEGDNLQNVEKENKEHVKGMIETRHVLEERKAQLQDRLRRAREGNSRRAKHIRNQIEGLDRTISSTRERTRRETNEGRFPVGPHALQALLYRQRYRSTMRGALEGGSWEAALAALPKSTRTAIVDVIHTGSDQDKRKLFSILPDDQKAVLGYALNIEERKIPKMQELNRYFESHPLPTSDWAGWRADASLDLIKARDIVTGHKHLDPMDFGIFPSTVDAATQGSPEADIALPTQTRRYRGTNELEQALHDLLVGHGLMGVKVEVAESPGGDDGHEADVNMQVSQRREHAFFHAFKKHTKKGAYA